MILLLIISVFIILFYLLTPCSSNLELSTSLPKISISLEELESYISKSERKFLIKENNSSKIYWATPLKKNKTPFSILYLHGFSSSPKEGYPVHEMLAKKYGLNLYTPRLFDHGLITKDPLLNFSAKEYFNSCKTALSIAKKLSDRVILIGCSTGGLAALYLASGHPDISAVVLYSPNVDLNSKLSFLLTTPLGKRAAWIVSGGRYRRSKMSDEAKQYWYDFYRADSLVELKLLINATMKLSTFKKISHPLFLGYYYKDRNNYDKTVSIKAMLNMYRHISTQANKKVVAVFPEANDHVIQSKYFSNAYPKVMKKTFDFLESNLGLTKRNHHTF